MRTPKLHDALLVHRATAGVDQPGIAIVSRVWGDTCVNAGGWNAGGSACAWSSLRLVQDDQPVPEHGPYAVFASSEANPNVFQA